MQTKGKRSSPFLNEMRSVMRVNHLSITTERNYVSWVARFIKYHNMKHPKDMGAPEVEQYLTYLAVTRKVSQSTQKIALCAIVYLYRNVLKTPLPENMEIKLSRRPKN